MSSELYDITIVGAGPAGLLLSVQLARWGYKIKHIDNRAEPTDTGRADGIQPRTLDLLKNMGFKRQLMAHGPARVYEVAFWESGALGKGIRRTGTWANCPKFIDSRHPYTTLLHQGYIERILIADLEGNGTTIQRPWRIVDFRSTRESKDYRVEVEIAHMETGESQKLRSKYLFSGEGAKSLVREKLGIKMLHKDPITHVWGVIDGVVHTDFPDIRMKCTIRSDRGSIMIIPRENNMVRLYVQLASLTDNDWSMRRKVPREDVQTAAKRILEPYRLQWERVEWYSVYPIGQGIAERYTLDEQVFLGGDACHTHSPKAGQGMNTAFLDVHNLAWKIHLVESGFADRSILSTYESERRAVAESLLNFDAEYAALFSERPPSIDVVRQSVKNNDDSEKPTRFVELYKSSCQFTSGYSTEYQVNILNWSAGHAAKSTLFQPKGHVKVGRLLPPANVIRVIDANEVHLEEEIPVSGAFRIYVFAGFPDSNRQALHDFATSLARRESFFRRFDRSSMSDADCNEDKNPHSRFFTFCTILAAQRPDVDTAQLPRVLARYRSHIYADVVPDPRVPGTSHSAHAKMGIDPIQGVVAVARPDGYIGCILSLVQGNGTGEALNEYFTAFAVKKNHNLLYVQPRL